VGDVKASGRRTYHSPVRDESARRTRQAIVEAATVLFEEHGYAGTSLATVARDAGVARPTVTAAFGSKPSLLKATLDRALAGDDEAVAVAERPWFRPVWDAATAADVLAGYAAVCTLIGSRSARMFEVVRRAADDGTDVADLWQTMQDNRRRGAAMVHGHARRCGGLRRGMGGERGVDVLWLLNDPAHYSSLVHHCGWRPGDFEAWLSAQMCAALLPVPAG
jgi:AcrR family transcriptional regulator